MTQLNNNPNTPVPPPIAMLQMISGFWISKAIYAVAKLGIADYLIDRPKTAEELAAITETHPLSLYRLLRALASVGIFAEDENHKFSLTPLAATLQTDVPGSLRFFAISELGTHHSLGWNNLLHSLKTGEIAFDNATGINIWEYYAQHPEDAKRFNQAMTNITAVEVAAIISSYNFSEFQNIVDIGGGQGSLLTQILKANQKLKGFIFDLPQVIEATKLQLQAEDIAHRVTAVAGNFFESVPEGGDAYLLKHIIHDWDEEKATTILKNCHQAMPQHSKLLLFEIVIAPGNEQSFGKLLDLNMLVMAGGRERTQEEYRALLKSAGFQLTRIIPTPSIVSIIEAVKV
ncbi:hydroxyneurosporene-O-methyltransferase [Calothrix sp. NIES-2100]|uniref:methyltransferase n=1 Tax=Calothrix sp. NIES-2100 TaxID=1954172 RepID=UPI000B6071F7|nr:hydroxyneurosporene-O-methyltransferase [Calothrix sp. NIES-2100]